MGVDEPARVHQRPQVAADVDDLVRLGIKKWRSRRCGLVQAVGAVAADKDGDGKNAHGRGAGSEERAHRLNVLLGQRAAKVEISGVKLDALRRLGQHELVGRAQKQILARTQGLDVNVFKRGPAPIRNVDASRLHAALD